VRKLVLVSMLALFATAIALPVLVAPQSAVAAEKKKSKMKIEKKKKPSSKM
jgi:hypothetical protein